MICLRSVRPSTQTAYNQTTCGVSKMTDRQLESTGKYNGKEFPLYFKRRHRMLSYQRQKQNEFWIAAFRFQLEMLSVEGQVD